MPLLNSYAESQLAVGANTAVAPQTFTFGGLNPGSTYDLYAIVNNDWPTGGNPGFGGGATSGTVARNTMFVVSGQSATVITQPNWATETVSSPGIYTEFVGLTPTAGSITITAQTTVPSYGNNYLTDVSGFQLVPVTLAILNTNLVATNTRR